MLLTMAFATTATMIRIFSFALSSSLLLLSSRGFSPTSIVTRPTDVRIPLPSLTHPPIIRSNKPSALDAVKGANGIELANLLFDSTSTAFDAWEWTANLGAPAALVAGAVLVTLSETREAMQPRKTDKNWYDQN